MNKFKKKKILIVDDELDIQKVIAKRVEANGYEALVASGGKEALEKINKENPDAVILDIMMPEIDGIDVLMRIRQTRKNLPIFMITAYSTEERFKLANKLDATGFIDKTGDSACILSYVPKMGIIQPQ